MKKQKELFKNTLIIFVGKFCTQFISFLLVPIYTYFLSTEDYGYIDLIQTYISLLVPIIILRFDTGVFRFLIDERRNENEKGKTISTVIYFLILQIILFVLIFIISNFFLNIKYALAILLNIIFMSISSVLLQISRGTGDNKTYSIASILTAIITIILNCIFIIILRWDASAILVVSGISNCICSVFLIFKNGIYKCVNFKNIEKKRIIKILKYSLPMIPDGLSWWVVNAFDRTIISFVISSSANGIYAVSSKFSNILSSLFQVFNMSWQESASLHINDYDKDAFFSEVLNETYKIFYSICLLLLTSMPFVFKTIIGLNYFTAYYYVPILLLANLFNAFANTVGGVYIAQKKTITVAKTTLYAALINIIINLIFIKKIGLYAAAISTLISYMFLAIYRYKDVQKYFNMKIDKKFMVISLLEYMLCCFIYYQNKMYLNIINIIISLIICCFLNKRLIQKILKKIGEKIK